MEYQVDITDTALADAEAYVRFIREEKHEPYAAEIWWNGLMDSVLTLERMPERCSVIPENEFFPEKLRHLVYHSHRIIFRVERRRKRVTILRIYHASRKSLIKSARKSSQ